MRVYIGTYTTGDSQGIYRLDFDPSTGQWLSGPVLAAAAVNPSFLARHPRAPRLYAVNEVRSFDGARTGAVSAYAQDEATGRLAPLNQQASGGVRIPATWLLDATGRQLLVANYTCGSVSVLPVAGDGRLGAATSTYQCEGAGPMPHGRKGRMRTPCCSIPRIGSSCSRISVRTGSTRCRSMPGRVSSAWSMPW